MLSEPKLIELYDTLLPEIDACARRMTEMLTVVKRVPDAITYGAFVLNAYTTPIVKVF